VFTLVTNTAFVTSNMGYHRKTCDGMVSLQTRIGTNLNEIIMNKKTKVGFVANYNLVEANAVRIAKEHGWVIADTNESKGMLIALMHSELSEALEAVRHGNPQSEKIPEFTLLEEELADVVLRIMNFGGQLGLNIADAVLAKDEYNSNRPYKHGGKAF